MKTLYITRGNNIVIDTENNTVDKFNTCRQAIDYIYLVEEPVHIVYGSGDIKTETDADKGDIIITFYDKVFKHQMIVVKNDQWAENLIEYKKKEQEEKERWAEANGCDACSKCKCDNC